MAGIIDETKKAVLEQNGYSVYIPWSGTKESTVFFSWLRTPDLEERIQINTKTLKTDMESHLKIWSIS